MISGAQIQFDRSYQSPRATDSGQQVLPDEQSQFLEMIEGDGKSTRGEFHPVRINQSEVCRGLCLQ